jgi:hypothetical protein
MKGALFNGLLAQTALIPLLYSSAETMAATNFNTDVLTMGFNPDSSLFFVQRTANTCVA